jgi:hypothetical protein
MSGSVGMVFWAFFRGLRGFGLGLGLFGYVWRCLVRFFGLELNGKEGVWYLERVAFGLLGLF